MAVLLLLLAVGGAFMYHGRKKIWLSLLITERRIGIWPTSTQPNSTSDAFSHTTTQLLIQDKKVSFFFKTYSFVFTHLFRCIVKHEGDLPWELVLMIAKDVRPRSMAVEFKGTIKEVLGQAKTMGVTVGGKNPIHLQKDIDAGKITLPKNEDEINIGYMQWVTDISEKESYEFHPEDFKTKYVKPLTEKSIIPYIEAPPKNEEKETTPQ